jgi:hypothetical protein
VDAAAWPIVRAARAKMVVNCILIVVGDCLLVVVVVVVGVTNYISGIRLLMYQSISGWVTARQASLQKYNSCRSGMLHERMPG